MHFALPPRKTSSPPVYTRASIKSAATLRTKRVQYLSYTVLCALTLCLLYTWFPLSLKSHNDKDAVPAHASIIILTVFNEATMSEDYMAMIRANRNHYALRHGFKTFYTNASTYSTLYGSSPSSWATVPALRSVLAMYPETDYIWSLTPHALITNFTLDLRTHILNPLPNLMLKDIPVVPPDSVIHTFSHLKTSTTNLILTQDQDNIAHTSLILRNTLTLHSTPSDTWTSFFLDAWFDPLYRAYSFQKAENHALEHMIQWHPTILANLAIVPQRALNSYNFAYPQLPGDPNSAGREPHDSMWQEGDLLVNFKGCIESAQRDCEEEMRLYFDRWERDVKRLEGRFFDLRLRTAPGKYVPKKQGIGKTDAEKDWELKRTHV